MSENMALLSQKEIDVLVEFLLQQRKKVGMEVMDQDSIDRLISLLRSDSIRNVKYNTIIPEAKGQAAEPILLLEGESGLESQKEDGLLECAVEEGTGYFKVFCRNAKTGKKYVITPKCMEQIRYIEGDGSEWGYAIPPMTFDQIAALLQVRYTKKTFDMVCEVFAAKLFGKTVSQIPDLYMPTAYNLIHHLVG